MPDNRKPLIYGAFPVCRNYTVRAHLRHHSPPERRRCKDGVLHAGALRCRVHPPHLHPRNKAKAGRGSSHHGQFYGTSDVEQRKKLGGKRKLHVRHSLFLSSPFGVWVKMWVNQLPHILTHTEKSKIATKKPRKPKFSRLFGAATQI